MTTTFNPLDIIGLSNSLLENITPGKWHFPRSLLGENCGEVHIRTPEGGKGPKISGDVGYFDACFIAAAPDLVRELVKECEASREKLRILDALEVVGVKNWHGYEDAQKFIEYLEASKDNQP